MYDDYKKSNKEKLNHEEAMKEMQQKLSEELENKMRKVGSRMHCSNTCSDTFSADDTVVCDPVIVITPLNAAGVISAAVVGTRDTLIVKVVPWSFKCKFLCKAT